MYLTMLTYAQTIDPNVKRILLKSLRTGLYVSAWSRYTGTVTADSTQDKLSYPQVFNYLPVGEGKYL